MVLFVAVFEVITADMFISCLAAFDDVSGAAIWIKSPSRLGWPNREISATRQALEQRVFLPKLWHLDQIAAQRR